MCVASIALLAQRVSGVYGGVGAVLVMLPPLWLAAWLSDRPGPWLILSFAAVLPRLSVLARGGTLPVSIRLLVPAFGDAVTALLGTLLCGHPGLFAAAWLSLLPLQALQNTAGPREKLWMGIAFLGGLLGLAGVQAGHPAGLIESSLLDVSGTSAALLTAILMALKLTLEPVIPSQPFDRTDPLALAALNHELRTPLNAIIGFAGLMQALPPARTDPTRYGDYARMIEASGEHVLAVLEAAIGAAAQEACPRAPEPGILDMSASIRSSLEMLAPAAAARGITLRFAEPERPMLARAGKRAAQQILVNLLSNAVKFSPTGATVDISLQRQANSEIEIGVRDRGIGIAADDLAGIGTPYRRTHNARQRGIEGTGLGLAICQQLAREHGGQVRLESALGEGTTARLTLPAAYTLREPRYGTGLSTLFTLSEA